MEYIFISYILALVAIIATVGIILLLISKHQQRVDKHTWAGYTETKNRDPWPGPKS